MKRLMAIAVATVLLLAMVISAPVAAQTTWHVDDDGVQWPGAYTTITAALTATTTLSSHTIIVHKGTYTENVLVDKDVTLQSAKKHKAEVIGSTYTGDAVRITAAGATVEGFHVRIAAAHDGIAVKANGVTVRNNKVTGPGPFTGWVAPTGAGISAILCDDVTIENNDVRYTSGVGIWLCCTNSLISKNKVQGTQYTGILLAPWTWVSPWAVNHGNLIAENRVKNCGTQWNYDEGIRLGWGAYNNVVWKNDVKDSSRSGIKVVPTAYDNTLIDNKMKGSPGPGGGFDAQDLSTGGTRTAGTKNWWAGNKGKTENPAGLLK